MKMKQILVLLVATIISLGVQAQRKTIRGNFRPQVSQQQQPKVVVISPRPYYNPYAYGFSNWGTPWGFNRFGYDPFFGYSRQASIPSELELSLDQIRNDFAYEIANVRGDKSLSKSERKSRIRALKHERENAILEAKRNYYN